MNSAEFQAGVEYELNSYFDVYHVYLQATILLHVIETHLGSQT